MTIVRVRTFSKLTICIEIKLWCMIFFVVFKILFATRDDDQYIVVTYSCIYA